MKTELPPDFVDDRDYIPPFVIDVTNGNMTSPTPPLDQSWSDLEKLRWHAALASYRTGLNIRVNKAKYWIDGVFQYGLYSVMITGYSSGGGGDFYNTWTYINGIELGANARDWYSKRDELVEKPRGGYTLDSFFTPINQETARMSQLDLDDDVPPQTD